MSNLSNARAQLEEWEAKKPGDYTSQYKDKIDGVMGQLDGMKGFSYDPTRDAAYEQYKNSYTRRRSWPMRTRRPTPAPSRAGTARATAPRQAREPTRMPWRA